MPAFPDSDRETEPSGHPGGSAGPSDGSKTDSSANHVEPHQNRHSATSPASAPQAAPQATSQSSEKASKYPESRPSHHLLTLHHPGRSFSLSHALSHSPSPDPHAETTNSASGKPPPARGNTFSEFGATKGITKALTATFGTHSGSASSVGSTTSASGTAVSSSGTSATVAATVATPFPSSAPRRKFRSRATSLWESFYRFAVNSKTSDALVYAATRRESFVQQMRRVSAGDTRFTANTETDLIELWVIMALRFLLQGRLLFSPQLSAATEATAEAVPMLDLQGVLKDQWTWQLALDYPTALVYGYRLRRDRLRKDPTGHLRAETPEAHSGVYDGPPNFFPFAGRAYTQLPFEDNHFQAIVAKSLWYYLKTDEWADTLAEMYRVLRPGGWAEFVVADFDQLNTRYPAGVEIGAAGAEPPPYYERYFWDQLALGVKRRGMDVYPSRKLVARLRNAGFRHIRRTYLALPKGGWGGQVGQLTDLLSSYFTQSMFLNYAELTPQEQYLFRKDMSDLGQSGGVRRRGTDGGVVGGGTCGGGVPPLTNSNPFAKLHGFHSMKSGEVTGAGGSGVGGAAGPSEAKKAAKDLSVVHGSLPRANYLMLCYCQKPMSR